MSDAAATVASDRAVAAWRLATDETPDLADAPLPAGWFVVGDGTTLPVGGVAGTRALGMELVIWRGEDARARVLPARCPHAGVNMAYGGKVHGDWLECPFHSWRWDEAGTLRDIPYSVKPIKPKEGCPPRWPTRERGGTVLVWHHPGREDPSWEPAVPADGRPLHRGAEWLIAGAAAAVHAAMLDTLCGRAGAPMRKVPANGKARRITAPFPLRGMDEDEDRVEVTGAGPGLAWLRHLALPTGGVLIATTPVDARLTRVQLAAADGSTDDRAFLAAVTRRLDRTKAMLARVARHTGAARVNDKPGASE